MLNSKRQLQILVVSALAGSLFVTGCATKKYVRETVDAKVTEKVAPIEKKVTDLSAAVKDNAERIDAVDVRAKQGIADAATARTAAGTAQTAATQASTAAATAQTAANGAQTAATNAQRAADAASQSATTVNNRVTTVINGLDRFTAGPVQKVMFKVNSSVLSDDAKKTLDGIAGGVANRPAGYRVEIQGFASAEGKEAKNIELSQARAESVQRYLVSKGVPVIRTSILGVGPIGDKKDKKDALEANRRVEVRVYTAS